MEYKKTKYDFIVIGSDGEVYTTYYPGYTKKKCGLRKGIKTFKIRINGNKRTVGVAKLVGELFVPNPKKYKYVLTSNENEMDTRPENLYWSKSNRMDYKAFSEKKKGMVYKSYIGNIYGDYKVVEDKDGICIKKCVTCNEDISVVRNLVKSKKVCDNCVNRSLSTSSLKSAQFKNWEIKEKGTEQLILDKKELSITCKCCGQNDIISYIKFKRRTSPYYCEVLKSKRSNLIGRFGNMKSRCYNPNCKSYKTYGKRGITICDEWLNDTESFIKWSLDNGYKPELEIDRIDGNYEPSNCQYISKEKNSRKQVTKLFSDKIVKKIKYTDWGNLDNRQIADCLGYKKERVKYGNTIGEIRRGKLYKHI